VSRIKNIPRVRFHDLRHTHATQLLLAGVHPKVAQERLRRSGSAPAPAAPPGRRTRKAGDRVRGGRPRRHRRDLA
jgi:hypothetical protein